MSTQLPAPARTHEQDGVTCRCQRCESSTLHFQAYGLQR